MQITKSSIATGTGSAEWFTGQVYVDTATSPTAPPAAAGRERPLHAERADRLAHPPTSYVVYLAAVVRRMRTLMAHS